MPTLRELITRLSFQADTKPLLNVGKAIEGIKSRLNLLVGVEAIKGIAALTDKFGNFALDLRNAAAAAGLSTDEFQKLTFAAAQAGISQETMSGTLKSLNKRLQEARMGSEQAALAFAYAGIQPEQLGSFRNAEDALYALGKSLTAIQDPVRRAASAQDTLGEQGPRLLASLAATSGGFRELAQSAEATANVIDPGSLESLAKAEQSMAGLRMQAHTLSIQLASGLAPAITGAIKSIRGLIFNNQGLIKADFKEWAKKAAYALGAVAGVIAGLAHDARLLLGRFLAWGKTSGTFKRLGEDVYKIFLLLKPLFPLLLAGLSVFERVLEATLVSVDRLFRSLGDSIGKISVLITRPLDIVAWAQALGSLTKLVYEVARAPTSVVVAGLMAIYDAGKRLISMLFEGFDFKKTWLGRLVDTLSEASSAVANMRAFKKGNAGGGADKPPADIYGAVEQLNSQSVLRMQGAAPDQTRQVKGFGIPPTATVNAPITLTINGDANSKPVLNAVKEGVSEHFEMVMRQTQAGMAPGMVY